MTETQMQKCKSKETNLGLKEFQEWLTYNKETGDLHWRKSPSRRVHAGDKADYLRNDGRS